MILALDADPVKSVESFRRLLRRRVVEDSDSVFRLRRDNKERELIVRYRR